jgi:hypothetical protein
MPDIARQARDPVATPPESSDSSESSGYSAAPSFSPCQRLWARYHSGPEHDKVEILEELIEHGCLERSRRSLAGPEVPVT